MENIIVGVVSFLLFIYLFAAMLRRKILNSGPAPDTTPYSAVKLKGAFLK